MIEGRRFVCVSLRDYGRRLYKPPMQYVLTVSGDPRPRPLTAALVDAARRAIDSSRSTAGAAHWPPDGTACALPLEGSEPPIPQPLGRAAVGRLPLHPATPPAHRPRKKPLGAHLEPTPTA